MDNRFGQIKPIGIIRSPYKTRDEAPPQGEGEFSEIEVFSEYEEGLKDIDGFSHLHIFYWLHKSKEYDLMVKTPWDENMHGLFATRSPERVNPIGYTVVELIAREGRFLKIRGLDAIEGTPVLDIKPYIPKIDVKSEAKSGWLEKGFLKPRQYEFTTGIRWVEGKRCILSSVDKHNIESGCSPEFGGSSKYWSPQHLFVSSVEVCILTTFLWLLEKNRLGTLSYMSEAVGRAEIVGREFKFSEVEVKPVITVNAEEANKVYQLIFTAGERCMVSKAVRCKVILKPTIKSQT